MSKRKICIFLSVILLSFSIFQININSFAEEVSNETISDEEFQFSGSKKCKDDNGFTNPSDIKMGDKHYGWELGYFKISGYTRIEDRETDNPIFLKNVGDTVKLSFVLEQDIDKLNGNSKLKINNDKKAYDEYFGIEQTSFGKGALIIKYTDYKNNSDNPQIYTDYLKGIEVGADTKIQLCEEGDYEISLDYSLLSETFGNIGKIPTSKIATSEDDYKISFKFSVRNGNCMVYPFDVKSGKELTNTAFTENGFRLDLAKSRYLKVDITKQVLNAGKDGLTEDTRFNKPAKDGEEFTEEGIYTITVTNPYTNRSTEKIIYVGSDSVLQAYVTNQSYTISEINGLLENGAIINDDGTIIMPITTENVTVNESLTQTVVKTEENSETEISAITKSIESNDTLKKNNYIIPVLTGIGIIVVLVAVIFVLIKKTRR